MAEIRPTADRIRETLFNWLQPVVTGARCLDLFAGTGVLSFEALSRGAAQAVAVESHHLAVKALLQTCSTLGIQQRMVVKHQQAQTLLALPPEQKFDVVFVDPPFDHMLADGVCESLHHNGWLSAAALVYVETARNAEIHVPDSWRIARHKQAGNVAYRLYEAS